MTPIPAAFSPGAACRSFASRATLSSTPAARVKVVHWDDPAMIAERGLNGPFVEIAFDFSLKPEVANAPFGKTERAHLAVLA